MFGRRLSLLDFAVAAFLGTFVSIYTLNPLIKESINKEKNQASSSESSETSKKS